MRTADPGKGGADLRLAKPKVVQRAPRLTEASLMTKLIEAAPVRRRAARENVYATPLSKFPPGNPELFRTDTLCVALHQPNCVDDMKRRQPLIGDLPFDKSARHDAGRRAARNQHGRGNRTYEPNPSTPIDKLDSLPDQNVSRRARRRLKRWQLMPARHSRSSALA